MQKGRGPGRGWAERSQPGPPQPDSPQDPGKEGLRSDVMTREPAAQTEMLRGGGHPVCLQPKANPSRAQDACETSIAIDKIQAAHQNTHIIVPARRKLFNSPRSGDHIQKLPSLRRKTPSLTPQFGLILVLLQPGALQVVTAAAAQGSRELTSREAGVCPTYSN